MPGTFDYVRYDDQAASKQKDFKEFFIALEAAVLTLPNMRARSLAVTKLEEAYMWIGKAIRDEQIARGGDAKDQPQRG